MIPPQPPGSPNCRLNGLGYLDGDTEARNKDGAYAVLPEVRRWLRAEARADGQLKETGGTAHSRCAEAQVGVEHRVLVLVQRDIGKARRAGKLAA